MPYHFQKSHSTWVRGLKYHLKQLLLYHGFVALYMGAWIEIVESVLGVRGANVALYMGAWIEIINEVREFEERNVALYMGAWIEMCITLYRHYRFPVALYMGAWIEIRRIK